MFTKPRFAPEKGGYPAPLALFLNWDRGGGMSNSDWGGLVGGFVTPFNFDNKSKNSITLELKKFVIDPEELNRFIQGLEKSIEIHSIIKDQHNDNDTRKDTIAKLNKAINGLSKAIGALKSLDYSAQEIFSQHTYLSEVDLLGTRSNKRWKTDPTEELSILFEAAKSQLGELTSERYTRNDTPRFLVGEIIKKWRRYAHKGKFVTDVSMAWRDYERGKTSPEVSLWVIVRMVLKYAGVPLKDPSNYIQEALEFHKNIESSKLG